MSKKQHHRLGTIASILMLSLILPIGGFTPGFLPSAAAITETQLYITPLRVGTHSVPEGSGIVASRAYPGIYWMIADSGNPAKIYAIDGYGSTKRTFDVSGASNYDWEDIAIDDSGHLWIGDIGDNSQSRSSYVLYRVSEPNPYGSATSVSATAYRFNYPNGKYDAEALFVWQGVPYVVQKRSTSSEVYMFPYLDSSRTVTLSYVGRFAYGTYITGADISRDGRRLALITYGSHWIIERSAYSSSVADFFNSPSRQWKIKFNNNQGEAIGFYGGGYGFMVASEGGDLWKIEQQKYDQSTSGSTTTSSGSTSTTTSSTASLTFEGYDYDNSGEVSVLVNNQLVAKLASSDFPSNNNVYVKFKLDISKYLINGENTVTFRQNIYSSGVRNLQITGQSSTIFSDSTYHAMWVGGVSTVTYKFNYPAG